jgi:hypothetical protein
MQKESNEYRGINARITKTNEKTYDRKVRSSQRNELDPNGRNTTRRTSFPDYFLGILIRRRG